MVCYGDTLKGLMHVTAFTSCSLKLQSPIFETRKLEIMSLQKQIFGISGVPGFPLGAHLDTEQMTEESASHHVFEQMDRYYFLQRLPDTP